MVCEQSSENQQDRTSFDWCCFYHFVRNSLVALLEALSAQILFFGFVKNNTDQHRGDNKTNRRRVLTSIFGGRITFVELSDGTFQIKIELHAVGHLDVLLRRANLISPNSLAQQHLLRNAGRCVHTASPQLCSSWIDSGNRSSSDPFYLHLRMLWWSTHHRRSSFTTDTVALSSPASKRATKFWHI